MSKLAERPETFIVCTVCQLPLYKGKQQEMSEGHYQMHWERIPTNIPKVPLKNCPRCSGTTTQQARLK